MRELFVGIIIGLLTNLVWGVLLWILKKVKLIQGQIALSTVLLVGGSLIMIISIIAVFVYSNLTSPQASDLSSYTSIILVSEDTDGSDFEWVSGEDHQALAPELADVSIGNLGGRFVRYPVELRSTKDSTGYSDSSNGLTARPQRALRNYEREDLNTLLATVYIESDEITQLSVVPYLEVPESDPIYLGFGQVVTTNQWSLILWRDVTDSNRYTDDFFNDLGEVRDQYNIRDSGFLRLTHVLAVRRIEGTAVGFAFRLLSDKGQDEEDTLKATIYISSVTFMS